MGINESMTVSSSGLRKFSMINFGKSGLNFSEYLNKHPNTALVNNLEHKCIEKEKTNVCPEILLTQEKTAMEYLDTEIFKFIKREGYPVNVLWDYEYNVWNGPLSCYCSKCINKFKSQYSIDGELSFQMIRSKHSVEWIDFMNRRMAGIAKILQNRIKKISPDSIFSVYSGYQSNFATYNYGIDWKMLRGSIDLACCGYGRMEKEIRDTLDALGPTPLCVGEIVMPYIWSSRDTPTFLTKANLMRRVCDGTGGVLFYAYYSMNGISFYSIAEISRFVAENEEFFINRKNISKEVKISGIPRDGYEFFESDGKKILILMNLTEKEMHFKWEIGKDFKIIEYYSGNIYSNSIIEDDLSVGDAKAFILVKQK